MPGIRRYRAEILSTGFMNTKSKSLAVIKRENTGHKKSLNELHVVRQAAFRTC
jgi:hypothetical protein